MFMEKQKITKIVRIFIKFLKINNVFHLYLINVPSSTLLSFSHDKAHYFVIGYFGWTESEQNMWLRIHGKWQKFLNDIEYDEKNVF